MRVAFSLALGLMLVACGEKNATAPVVAPALILSDTKSIPPQLEWNRGIYSSHDRTIRFIAQSEGPFAITVVTDRAYQALIARNRAGFHREDVLFTTDSKQNTYEGTVIIPAGQTWFILENQTDRTVQMRLQCFRTDR